jgi:hypothetical protein
VCCNRQTLLADHEAKEWQKHEAELQEREDACLEALQAALANRSEKACGPTWNTCLQDMHDSYMTNPMPDSALPYNTVFIQNNGLTLSCILHIPLVLPVTAIYDLHTVHANHAEV